MSYNVLWKSHGNHEENTCGRYIREKEKGIKVIKRKESQNKIARKEKMGKELKRNIKQNGNNKFLLILTY